jgi:NAD(P)-dependent dehydrogenase (short-subunit alcohol dehydrogenase family)
VRIRASDITSVPEWLALARAAKFGCWSADSFSAGTVASILQAVHQLAQSDPTLTVLLGSRDAARGASAVKQLNLTNVQPLTIDVTSASSLKSAAEEVQTKYGGLADLLCNNAGIYLQNDSSDDPTVVDDTLTTNFYAVLNANAAFAPLLRANARVVNVASDLGLAAMADMSPAVKKQFIATPDIDSLTEQMKQFRTAYVEKKTRGRFSSSAYGMSKAAVIVATRIMAQQAKNGITYFSATPGQIHMRMRSPREIVRFCF